MPAAQFNRLCTTWCCTQHLAQHTSNHCHIKIANPYENYKRPCRNPTPKSEICKLIWKLQTDWKLQSNSHVSVYGSYVDICNFHMRDFFWKRIFRLNKPRGASPRRDYVVKRMVLVQIEYNLVLTLHCVGIYQKRGGTLRGLRIKWEISILRKPPIEVVLLLSQ